MRYGLNRLRGLDLHRRLWCGIVGWPRRVLGLIPLFVWTHVPVGWVWCSIAGSSDLRGSIERLRRAFIFELSLYSYLRGHGGGRKQRKVRGNEGTSVQMVVKCKRLSS